jgi:ribosomal protein L23
MMNNTRALHSVGLKRRMREIGEERTMKLEVKEINTMWVDGVKRGKRERAGQPKEWKAKIIHCRTVSANG